MEYYATVEELLLLYRVGGTTTETSTIATTGGGEHPTIILQERANLRSRVLLEQHAHRLHGFGSRIVKQPLPQTHMLHEPISSTTTNSIRYAMPELEA